MKIGHATLVCLALAQAAGCGGPPDFDACKYRGNSRTEQTCAISYIYLVAHPEKFDGRDVEFFAWARTTNGATLVFPTKEAMEDGESVASMAIYGDETASGLQQRNLDTRVIIKGRFILNRGKTDPLDIDRIGVIRNAKVLP